MNGMLSATSAEPNIYRTEMIFSQPNAPAAGNDSAHSMTAHRFPPPWTAEETDACFIVRDDQRAGARLRGAFIWGSFAPR